MKVLFDTNVLVAAFVPQHPNYAACRPWFQVQLDVADYVAAIDRVTQYGLVSGAVFDAVIAQAGLKVGADRLLTFNVRDFERLGDEICGLIQVPGA